jgi:NADPH:quinone reductase-like Zn-dependent oxidoreductase
MKPTQLQMKAICVHAPGGREEVFYEDTPIPEIRPGDALVRVRATGITPTELSWIQNYPNIPGHEVSGVVETARDDSSIHPGDSVFALTDFARNGAAAEFVAVRAADLAPKPRTADFVHSAAAPLSALTAWQALFDHAGLKKNDRILIHGAAGGVGTFAVQLARQTGAYVIATASSRNTDLLRSLGASEVIDYKSKRFEDGMRPVDVVLDSVGGDTLARSWSVLTPGGVLVSIAEPISREDASAHNARGIYFIVKPDREELSRIAALIDSGSLRLIVTRVLPLARAAEAFDHGSEHHSTGKTVLEIM